MSSFDPLPSNILAVLHRQGEQWACVAGELEDSGRARIIDARLIGDDERIQPWIDSMNAGSVRVVIPASETICRTCSLPDGSPEELEEAVRLQAESQLLGSAPAHRLGIAIMPGSDTDTVRTGLILAWPESSPWSPPPLETTPLYAPDVAGLCALLNDTRPADPLLWVDSDESSLCVAITHLQGIQVRGLREDFRADSIGKLVSNAVIETGLKTDLPMDRLKSMARTVSEQTEDKKRALIVPQEVQTQISERLSCDADIDGDWLENYAVACGVLLATSSDLISLTMLQRELPVVEPTLLEATTDQLSNRRIATWLLVAAVIVFIFAPLLLNGVRFGLLQIAHPSLEDQIQQNERLDRQHAMYRAISSQAWPMTKLLGDVASSLPMGVDLETVRLSHGQPLKLTGKATPSDGMDAARLVTTMKDQLESTGVFDDVTLRWENPETYGPRTFTIEARVARPLLRPRYAEDRDFAALTLAQRKYGIDAVTQPGTDTIAQSTPTPAVPKTPPARPAPNKPTDPTAVADADASSNPSRRSGSSRRPTARSGDGTSRGDSDSRAGNAGTAMSGRIPEMLTQEQIEGMSAAEIRQQLVEVSGAKKFARNNPEIQAQLQEQFNLLMDGLKSKSKP
ncbi:MAG: hypothetical protein CMJ40_01620 [Phycisphaerae bacterium]|nr:hypothetical protein [Phycisphaerae bacterium]